MAETIYRILRREHDEARETLRQLADSTTEDAQMRRDKATDMAIDLISHNEAEAQILYQRLMKFEDLREDVEEHLAEHEEANEELRALLDMDAADEQWIESLKELKRAIEQHIEYEEEDLFFEAKYYIEEEEAEKLAVRYEAEQSRRRGLLTAA
ncbi:MAG: hemerythrin domain-containing protein [Gammaproteobacteria bacterium]|nr:hemerythrin domain-containing protein [Gammaproteobacteria bacterium]